MAVQAPHSAHVLSVWLASMLMSVVARCCEACRTRLGMWGACAERLLAWRVTRWLRLEAQELGFPDLFNSAHDGQRPCLCVVPGSGLWSSLLTGGFALRRTSAWCCSSQVSTARSASAHHHVTLDTCAHHMCCSTPPFPLRLWLTTFAAPHTSAHLSLITCADPQAALLTL